MSEHSAPTASITTLSEFFQQSGVLYRIIDMGRRVNAIDPAEFEAFERATTPYPLPFQRCALFGVLFWHPQAVQQHYVWFLRFPLDEQGLLLQAARDEFLVMVLDRVGQSMLAAANGQQLDGALKDSPYSFNPREDKLAAFNAQATRDLALPPSSFFDDAHRYFTGQRAMEKWPSLGMQGIADVAVRLDKKDDIAALVNTLPALPAPAFQMLSTFLENTQPAMAVVEAFSQRLQQALAAETVDVTEVCACLRAVSNTQHHSQLAKMVDHTLEHHISRHIEVLAVIVGRCWLVLQDDNRCHRLMERLAENTAEYDGFSHLLADLIYLPAMRTPVMAALRNPDRSEKLSQYVGQLFGH